MALQQEVLTITSKGGSVRAVGGAEWDSGEPAALLISATVAADPDDLLKRSGSSVRASIDAGVVLLQIDAPLTAAGDIEVVVTLDV